MSQNLVHFKKKDTSGQFEKKIFVCTVDDVVVGNIMNFDSNFDLMPVHMPDWNDFVKIMQSPNHKFIERSSCMELGALWNGNEFIVNKPIEEVELVYINVHNSIICYEKNIWIFIKDYTMYALALLRECLECNPSLELNIVFGTKKEISFNNNNKIVYICFNLEQTIIKDTEIELPMEPESKILFNDNQYTVNMNEMTHLNEYNIIFEYSKPNIKNLEISGLYPELLSKSQYVSACVYRNVNASQLTKTVDTLTLLSSMSTRREQKLQEINETFANHRNENYYFDDELRTLLENSKILINIHNSEETNTLEELRILPALMQRVLVVSEISPLNDLVPFGRMIIWSTYDNIVQKTKEVLENYETYYNEMFTEQNVNMLNNLHQQNCINVNNKLNEFFKS